MNRIFAGVGIGLVLIFLCYRALEPPEYEKQTQWTSTDIQVMEDDWVEYRMGGPLPSAEGPVRLRAKIVPLEAGEQTVLLRARAAGVAVFVDEAVVYSFVSPVSGQTFELCESFDISAYPQGEYIYIDFTQSGSGAAMLKQLSFGCTQALYESIIAENIATFLFMIFFIILALVLPAMRRFCGITPDNIRTLAILCVLVAGILFVSQISLCFLLYNNTLFWHAVFALLHVIITATVFELVGKAGTEGRFAAAVTITMRVFLLLSLMTSVVMPQAFLAAWVYFTGAQGLVITIYLLLLLKSAIFGDRGLLPAAISCLPYLIFLVLDFTDRLAFGFRYGTDYICVGSGIFVVMYTASNFYFTLRERNQQQILEFQSESYRNGLLAALKTLDIVAKSKHMENMARHLLSGVAEALGIQPNGCVALVSDHEPEQVWGTVEGETHHLDLCDTKYGRLELRFLQPFELTDQTNSVIGVIAECAPLLFEKSMAEERARASENNIIAALGHIIENRSRSPENRSRRIAQTSRLLGEIMLLDTDAINEMYPAVILRNIGFFCVPDSAIEAFLSLQADQEQTKLVKSHPQLGSDILDRLSDKSMRMAAKTVRYHSESYDGSGLMGIDGSKTPIPCQIVATAVCLEQYLYTFIEHGKTIEKRDILEFLAHEKGRKLNPLLSDALVGAFERVIDIYSGYISEH